MSILISSPTLAIAACAIALAWAGGRVARRVGQPAVIGEMTVGFILGPSGIGVLAPELASSLLTRDVTDLIAGLATAAVLVFMLLVGLELDGSTLRREARSVARIAVVSLVVPFGLGCWLAAWLYESHAGASASWMTFTLFLGIAMSITAMPVLTRILADLRMLTTVIGTIAIGCAVIGDVVAWTLLGIVVGLVRGKAVYLSTISMTAVYLLVMLLVVRPCLSRLELLLERKRIRGVSPVIVALAAAVSGVIAERIGLHAIFGVFLLGACVPRRGEAFARLERPLRIVSGWLLPAFFIVIGLRTDLRLAGPVTDWPIMSVILICAVVGKLGGSALAARSAGLRWRSALTIGALLNTRGLVELVALDIGRTLGIISAALFTMLVVMTFVTTTATAPLVRWLSGPYIRRMTNAESLPPNASDIETPQ